MRLYNGVNNTKSATQKLGVSIILKNNQQTHTGQSKMDKRKITRTIN